MRTAKQIIALVSMVSTATYVQAQGSLSPPGAPAPTMKTLQQIEPRTPLESGSPGVSIDPSGTIIISQSGSYYLTEDLTVSSGNGITINASGVTVDLRGFTIRSTLADSASSGIDINAARVSIYNGHIESGTTYIGGSGDQYTGPGFDYGILAGVSSNGEICIRDISVVGCDKSGIYIGSEDSLVESCTVKIVGIIGIRAGIVNQCTANTCGSTAIAGISVNDCSGKSTGSDGIQADMVANSYGYTSSASADGISAYGIVQNSYGRSSGGYGIYAGRTVQNSYGRSSSGGGIRSNGTVSDSYGYTYSGSASADGIYAARTVQNSYGESTRGDGIRSEGTVSDSYGLTYGTATGNDGILSQGTVANSYGLTTGTATSSDGIHSYWTVQNSYGKSAGGNGIFTQVVSYSRGNSSGADGINASLAVGCTSVGGENIGNKYLMP